MKTEAANAFAKQILDAEAHLKNLAQSCAVEYAQTDNPASKASFDRYSFAAEQVRKLHGPACQAFHEVERLIADDRIAPINLVVTTTKPGDTRP